MEIAILAFGGTVFSTFFIGFSLYGICNLIDIHIDLIYCLLFGALISPTDPIAVLAIVKNLKHHNVFQLKLKVSHYLMMVLA